MPTVHKKGQGGQHAQEGTRGDFRREPRSASTSPPPPEFEVRPSQGVGVRRGWAHLSKTVHLCRHDLILIKGEGGRIRKVVLVLRTPDGVRDIRDRARLLAPVGKSAMAASVVENEDVTHP